MDAAAYLRGHPLGRAARSAVDVGRRPGYPAREARRPARASPARSDQRDHAGPRRQLVVLLVVERRAACRTFAEASSIGERQRPPSPSARSRVGGRASAQRPGTMCSTIASSAAQLLGAVARRCARAAEQHHRAVVGRVVHRRAREHQAVEERHRQADRGVPRRAPAACGFATEPWQ